MPKRKGQFLEKNPNWGGGRTITPHGYVLVKVPAEHHLVHISGYAYEHRLVLEEKLGRRLKENELTHHIDGNKQNNDPDNLVTVVSNAEHSYLHRKSVRGLRKPGEDNPMILCDCGCGYEFFRFDSSGRPRKYVNGHNRHPATLRMRIIESLTIPKGRGDLSRELGTTIQSIACALSRLKREGRTVSLGRGQWARAQA